MTGGGTARPRRVCVTRVGADAYLVVIGETVLALSWMEATALGSEIGEALDDGSCRRPRGS
jgi:hypothetical protein